MAVYNFRVSTTGTGWTDVLDWSAKKPNCKCGFQLIFNANGGTWSDGTSTIEVSTSYTFTSYEGYYGAKRVVPPKGDPQRSGYNFGGWLYGSTSSSTIYYDESFCPNTSNTLRANYIRQVYLYAKWSETPTPTTTTVRINYDADGGTFISPYGSGSSSYVIGTVSSYSSTIAQGTRSSGYTMTDGLFLGGKYNWVLTPPTGYVFKGWKCRANGRIMYTNSQVNYFSSSATSPYTIDVVAQWEIDASTWESQYPTSTIASGNLEYDGGCGKIFWKLLVAELGADYASNTSDLFFDFRAYSVASVGGTYDSRPYNYLYLKINPSGSDTGSSKYALNYTSGSTYYTDSNTGYNLMSQFNTANNSNYISLVAEASEICKQLFGTAGTTDGSKYKNVQWPHVISSTHSTNGLGCVTGQIYYNRASGASQPSNFTINSTSSALTLTKFDRSITYYMNGASGTAPSAQEKQYGTALTLRTTSWSGHTFNGWKCSSIPSGSSGTELCTGTVYSGGASFSDDTADGALGALYMYAQWGSTITLSLGTGASATATSISVNNGDVVTTTSTSPYQVLVNGTVKSTITFSSGYKFVSWSDSSYTVTDNKTITLTTGTTDPVTVYIQKGSGMYAGEFVEVSSKTDVDIYKTGQVKCYQLVETANTYNMYKSTYSYITMPAFIEYS